MDVVLARFLFVGSLKFVFVDKHVYVDFNIEVRGKKNKKN